MYVLVLPLHFMHWNYASPHILGLVSRAWPDPFRTGAYRLEIISDALLRGRLSSLIDNALREKGSGHARLE